MTHMGPMAPAARILARDTAVLIEANPGFAAIVNVCSSSL